MCDLPSPQELTSSSKAFRWFSSWTVLPLILCVTAVFTGCDGTKKSASANGTDGDETDSVFVSGNLSPKSTVRQCIANYQALRSYEDQATVELRYKIDESIHSDSAPLSIAWQDQGPIGFRVYSVVAGPGTEEASKRFRLRIDREDFVAQGQVLSREFPKKIDFAWLLDDRMVAQHVAAGLGGFPPQLDLLLSDEPMRQLVNDSAELAFGPPATIDGRACHVVNISQGKLTFRLFIDKATMLIRRIRLPSGNLPPEILANKELSDIQLWIDIKNAKANAPINWEPYRIRTKPEELLVNHFVPEPQPIEAIGLGRRVPAFELRGPSNDLVLEAKSKSSNSSSERHKATVLMWLADHPSCQVAAQQMAQAAKAITSDPAFARDVKFVSIWAEPNPPAGETFRSLQQKWGLPGTLAQDRDALGRDLFDINEAPSLVVLDENLRVQIRETTTNPLLGQVLPDLLARICGGADLAAEVERENQNLMQRYATELKTALAIDSPQSSIPNLPMQTYDPMRMQFGLIRKLEFESPLVSSMVDKNQQLWTLDESGALRRVTIESGAVRKDSVYETDWRAEVGDRLMIDAEGRYVALHHPGNASIELLDLQQNQAQTLKLSEQSQIVDLAWLSLKTSQSRLAAITGDGELVLLDPRNQEQLSGKCPAPPIAIVEGSRTGSAVDGLVVLSNRSVEALRIADDSTVKNVPGIGRPASFALGSKTDQTKLKLSFQPGQGPWISKAWSTGGKESSGSSATGQSIEQSRHAVLAQGWLAKNEPAIFLLDEQLRPLWHYRTPIQIEGMNMSLTNSAVDPASGQPVWVTADREHTVHVLRADGLTDHFRLDAEPRGLAFISEGEQLLLCVLYENEAQIIETEWK